MVALLNRGFIIRKFRYMRHRFNVEELHKNRIVSILPVPPVHPSQIREGRHFVRVGGIIAGTPKPKLKPWNVFLGQLKGIFRSANPTGNGNNDDKNRSEELTKREEEVKKWQETRERDIQHKFELESVWKAMKERQTLGHKKDGDDDKSDK